MDTHVFYVYQQGYDKRSESKAEASPSGGTYYNAVTNYANGPISNFGLNSSTKVTTEASQSYKRKRSNQDGSATVYHGDEHDLPEICIEDLLQKNQKLEEETSAIEFLITRSQAALQPALFFDNYEAIDYSKIGQSREMLSEIKILRLRRKILLSKTSSSKSSKIKVKNI